MKTVVMLTALLLSCANNPISNLNTAINGVEDDDELTLRLLFLYSTKEKKVVKNLPSFVHTKKFLLQKVQKGEPVAGFVIVLTVIPSRSDFHQQSIKKEQDADLVLNLIVKQWVKIEERCQGEIAVEQTI